MTVDLTDQERAFLTSLLTQQNVNPAAQNAVAVVMTVQTLLQKLNPQPEPPKG